MRNIYAVFMKQVRDTFKNYAVLVQLLIFPVMAVILESIVVIENMPPHFFMKLFSVMFVGMAPLISMSSIMSEEKEKNTLRALMMSNVTPVQYLAGTGFFLWLVCMAGSLIFGICGEYRGRELALFMLIMSAGIIISLIIGAVIGMWCANQSSAASISTPVMMIFSFVPMLAGFNDTIKKAADILYSQQMQLMINDIGNAGKPKGMIILAINLAIAAAVFIFAYKKRGLDK